jgi:anti-anti-sigma regulatory factor
MDTSGVHALLDADARARAQGIRLVVVVQPGPVRDLLRLTAAVRTLTLLPSRDAQPHGSR